MLGLVLVYAIRDLSLDGSRIGNVLDVLLARRAAEQFIDDVRRDDAQLAAPLRVDEIELLAGDGKN